MITILPFGYGTLSQALPLKGHLSTYPNGLGPTSKNHPLDRLRHEYHGVSGSRVRRPMQLGVIASVSRLEGFELDRCRNHLERSHSSLFQLLFFTSNELLSSSWTSSNFFVFYAMYCPLHRRRRSCSLSTLWAKKPLPRPLPPSPRTIGAIIVRSIVGISANVGFSESLSITPSNSLPGNASPPSILLFAAVALSASDASTASASVAAALLGDFYSEKHP